MAPCSIGVSFPLFMPSREWKARLRVDETYLVYVYYDTETRQIIATMHIGALSQSDDTFL